MQFSLFTRYYKCLKISMKKKHYEKAGIISMTANLLEELPLGANMLRCRRNMRVI